MTNFKYLWRPLYQTDDAWTVVSQSIIRLRFVWGMLGLLLQQEGADPKVAEMFYRAVIQALLIFGDETWVLLAAMEIKVKGTHTWFFRQITGTQAWQFTYRTWKIPGADKVREAAGTQ